MPVLDTHAHWGTLPFSNVMGSRDQVLGWLRQYRMDSAIFMAVASTDDFREGNTALASFLEQSPGIYGYVLIHPLYPEESVEEMRKYLSRDAFVGAAMHPYEGRYRVRRDDCREILNAYRRFAKPLFIETPDAEAVTAVETLAQEFPGIKFIMGNMGGNDWHEAIHACARHVNLYLELSGEPTALKISLAVEKTGIRRLLFGSDLGYSNPALILGAIEEAGLNEDQKQAILSGNATRLFGLSSPQEGSP